MRINKDPQVNKTGYLVNDFLTCIPGTTTFWHDLLNWIPGLTSVCNGNFKTIVSDTNKLPTPDYIIRNGSWFDPLTHKCPTIALLQDPLTDKRREQQLRVCNSATITVCNTHHVYNEYKNDLTGGNIKIIPLGTDFDLFTPTNVTKKYDVIFVGADSDIKNFALVRKLLNNKQLKFCLVMKYKCTEQFGNNVTVFSQIDHITLAKLYNESCVLICTSKKETQHLAGIEAGACNIPIVATNVGIYPHLAGDWGLIAEPTVEDFTTKITYLLNNTKYNPRQIMFEHKLDKQSCKESWINLINEISDT